MTNVIPIYHIGLIQAWFAALLVYRKPNKGAADRLLVIWLIVIGIEMLYSLLNAKYLTWLPDLIIIPLSYGPFLFFYTKLLTSKKPTTLRNIHRHLIPFYLFILIAAVWGKPIDIDSVNFYSKGPITWLAIFNYALFLIVILYYWRKLFYKIRGLTSILIFAMRNRNEFELINNHFNRLMNDIKSIF